MRRSRLRNSTLYALLECGLVFRRRRFPRRSVEPRDRTSQIREMAGRRTERTCSGKPRDSGLGVKEGVREAIRAMLFDEALHPRWS